MIQKFDAIIIGTGQAGKPLAQRLAAQGWQVAIIEKEFLGGTCINKGCTPTKAMVSSAKMAFQARRSNQYGINTNHIAVNLTSVVERKNTIIKNARKSIEKGFANSQNIQLIYGKATFSENKTLTIELSSGGTQTITAAHIFINTGARPSIPETPGLSTIPFLTSTSIMDLDKVPEHLVIIGGSYIALEFGQMFARFGSKVTILERSDRILQKEDDDISEEISKILSQEEIEILTGTTVKSVALLADQAISITVSSTEKEETITASHLLIATGRIPNTDELNLEKTGVQIDEKGYIKTNSKLETNIAQIYALGDVKPGPAFTHISYNDFVIVATNLLENGNMTIDKRQVPYCVFIDPELARVGLGENEAKRAGLNYQVFKLPMNYVARAIEAGETKGFMKAIVDMDTKEILGVSILGFEGGEIMSLLQMCMLGGITADRLKYQIFAHPTYAEAINNLFTKISK